MFLIEKFSEALKSRELREASTISLAKMLSAGLGFLAIIIVARSLRPSEFGLFSLAMAVMVIALELSGQGIDVGLVRFSSQYLETDKKQADLMFKAGFKLKIAASFMVFVVGMILAKPLAIYVFKTSEVTAALRMVFLGTFGASMWNHVLATFQAHQAFKNYAVLDLINSVLKITAVVVLCIVFTGTLFGILTAYAMIPFLCFFIGLLVMPKNFLSSSGPEKGAQLKIFNFSKWIILSGLINITFNRLDIFMLGYFKEASTVASYSAAFSLISIFDLLLASVVTVLLPKVSKISEKGQYIDYIQKSLLTTMVISIPLLPMFFLAKPLIIVLFSKKFIESISIFRILFFGHFITFIILPVGLIFFSLNLPHYHTFADMGILIFNFSGNYLAIPKYGAIGAAWVAVSTRILIVLVASFLVASKVLQKQKLAVEAHQGGETI